MPRLGRARCPRKRPDARGGRPIAIGGRRSEGDPDHLGRQALSHHQADRTARDAEPQHDERDSATNLPLEEAPAAARFRDDLLARFETRIALPALRERPEDVFTIAQNLAALQGAPLSIPDTSVEAVERLLLHDFRFNVRELGAILSARAPGPGLTDQAVGGLPRGRPGRAALSDAAIDDALARAGGNQSEAARALGVERAVLLRRLSRRKQGR